MDQDEYKEGSLILKSVDKILYKMCIGGIVKKKGEVILNYRKELFEILNLLKI